MPDLDAANPERELKIVASDYAMTTFLAEAVRTACARMPGLHFDILPLSTASAQLLGSGEIDLLFAGQALNIGVPPNETLFEEHFVCLLCTDTNPGTKRLSKKAYMARQHVVVRYFEHQMTFEDEEALRRASMSRRRQVSVGSYSLVPHLICGTPMIATVALQIAKGIQQRWPVSVVPFPFEHDPARIYAYWHPSRNGDAVLNAFMTIVRSVSRD